LRSKLATISIRQGQERNHQGKENLILFPNHTEARRKKEGAVRCPERLGGLLKYYERKTA
jgi:putative transposase